MEMDSNHVNSTQNRVEFDPENKPPPQPPPELKKRFVVHAEKDTFDFVAHRQIKKPTNTLESTGHLIKGCLGGGIMGIHEAYMKSGLWTSLVFTIIFGFYIAYCVHILIKSAQTLYRRLHITELSYPDLAEASLEVGPFPSLRKYSKWFRYAVDVVICIDLFGACCVYQIIIAKTIKEVIEDTHEEGDLNRLRLYVLTLLVPVLLLCMITTLKYLAPFSLIADVFIVTCVVATVVYGLQSAPPISTVPGWKDTTGFFEFCGIVIFSMEGIGVSLPIENNMKDPTQFPKVLSYGMTIVVLFLILVGFFGYWGFGEQSISPVTLNFPNAIFPTILKCLMGIMIFITFALNFWAPFNLVWYYVAKKHDTSKHWIWERVYRAAFVVIITAIAIAFPNIGNLMGLLGAFCLSNMGFIFPAVIELLVIWESPGLGRGRWRLWKGVLVILAGVLLFVAGTYSNLKGLIVNFPDVSSVLKLPVIWESPGLGRGRWRLWKSVLVILAGVLLFVAGTYSNLKGLIVNFPDVSSVLKLPVIWESPGLGRGRWRLWKSVLVILAGVLLFVAGTYSNLKGLIVNFPDVSSVLKLPVIWESPGLGRGRWRLWKSVLVILAGVLLFVAGTYSNLKGLIVNFVLKLPVIWESPGLGRGRWRLWKSVLVILARVLLFVAGTYSNLKGLIVNL